MFSWCSSFSFSFNIYCSCTAFDFEIHYLCIYSFATKKQNSVFLGDLKRLIWRLTFHEDLRGIFTAGGVSRVLRDRGITCRREARFTLEPLPEPEIWGSYLSRTGRRSLKSLSTAHAKDSSWTRTHGAPAGGSEIPEGLSWFPVLLCICNKHTHICNALSSRLCLSNSSQIFGLRVRPCKKTPGNLPSFIFTEHYMCLWSLYSK